MRTRNRTVGTVGILDLLISFISEFPLDIFLVQLSSLQTAQFPRFHSTTLQHSHVQIVSAAFDILLASWLCVLYFQNSAARF